MERELGNFSSKIEQTSHFDGGMVNQKKERG
jgi:hypothetical protein